MASRKGGRGRANIHMSKPEPPPFLQRMREEIVANEDFERLARSEQKRKDRPARAEDPEDNPTVVKVNDGDLTEEEYNRMKLELETQYKLNDDRADKKFKSDNQELDVDSLIKIRSQQQLKSNSNPSTSTSINKSTKKGDSNGGGNSGSSSRSRPKSTSKTLNYDSSSEEEKEEEEEK